MKYYPHLEKINRCKNGGRAGLYKLLAVYNLNYFFLRPLVVSLLFKNRYRPLKKLFYTILVGDYDRLNEIPRRLGNWDYVCYTDNPELRSGSWEIRFLDNAQGLDPVRLSRYYKINNHLIDTGYDVSVYTDANIRIRGDLDVFLAHAFPPGSIFSILLHPFLFSLDEEVQQCVEQQKDSPALVQDQYDHYLKSGYRDQYPHINARMMIRRTGDPAVRSLMETWFRQLQTWSKRDQLSFNYSLSICPNVPLDYIPYWIFQTLFQKDGSPVTLRYSHPLP